MFLKEMIAMLSEEASSDSQDLKILNSDSLIKHRLVPQIILPACQNGLSWGVKPKLIVGRGDRAVSLDRGNRLVIWVPGQTAWSGRGHTAYYEASLKIWRPGFVLQCLHEGGRFSAKLLAQYEEQINNFLELPQGVKIAKLWRPKSTFLLKE